MLYGFFGKLIMVKSQGKISKKNTDSMTNGVFQQFVEWVIFHGGIYVLLFIIFAETGLFLGFFLPGDSLLFVSGIYINDLASNFFHVHYFVIILLVIIASFTGNFAGYWFGNKTGPKMFEWKDNFLFKKRYLLKAKTFYQHYGAGTIFFSKFLPVLRTFAPIVAGIVQMPRKVFSIYNIAGSVCWVSIMMLGGHFLQAWIENKYGFSLKDNVEGITILIILITTVPVLYKLFKVNKNKTPIQFP
jgi:membrane-associated protein